MVGKTYTCYQTLIDSRDCPHIVSATLSSLLVDFCWSHHICDVGCPIIHSLNVGSSATFF